MITMDDKNTNNPCEGFGGGGALPRVSPNVRILLIDHNTRSLLSHSAELEQHLYKVSAAKSTKAALSFLRAQKNYYNIVIADLGLPELEIYGFIDKCYHMNIPLILMAEDPDVDIARKALEYGPCNLVDKPLSQYTIVTLWQHIYRVTGEMPTSLTETMFLEKEKYGNPSSLRSGPSGDGGASSQKRSNSKRKLVETEIESIKRTKNDIAGDLNSSFGTKEADGWNSSKSCMTWTSSLHRKFLQAINILGEEGANPETLLKLMNEPCLTLQHISALLQEYYRDQKAHSVNLQKSGGSIVPSVPPAEPMTIFLQIQIPSPNWFKPSNYECNFAGYNITYVKEKLDALNAEGARANSNVMLPSNHLSNGFEAPSQEVLGATREVIPASSSHPNNDLQAIERPETSCSFWDGDV